MHGSPGQGRPPSALGGCSGDDLLARLGLGVRGAPPIAPCGATGWGPSPWRTRRARGVAAARGAPRALNACGRAPSLAPWAHAVEPWGSCQAGGPWASGGMGQPCHGLPGSSPPPRRGKRRGSPRLPADTAWAASEAARDRPGTPGRRGGREAAWWPRVWRVCAWGTGLVCRVWTLPPEAGFANHDTNTGQCANLATSSSFADRLSFWDPIATYG